MEQWSFYILTFGCKVNQYESHAIREAWTRLGGRECTDPANAQVALINSCAVTARGERDARNALYRLRRLAPDTPRILTGCSAQLVAQSAGECINLLVPPRAKAWLMQDPRVLLEQGCVALPMGSAVPPFGPQGFFIQRFHRARPVVKIQDGCSHRCTYCIVPLMRGPSVSRPTQDVLLEIRRLFEAGYGEIMLSGINLHQYGRGDDASPGLWELVQLVEQTFAADYADKARIRLSSLDPASLTPRAAEVLSQSRLLCPHLHISLQNGSPKVLKQMGRGHAKLDRMLAVVKSMRDKWPNMGLGADLLMGFPGETEEDVAQTEALVKELQLNYVHVFPYSARPETPAGSFFGQVPYKEKIARAAHIRALVAGQQDAYLRELCALPRLHIVADAPHHDLHPALPVGTDDNASAQITITVRDATPAPAEVNVLRGVSEQYAPCRLLHDDNAPSAPAAGHGLIAVRPVRVENNTLVVQPI